MAKVQILMIQEKISQLLEYSLISSPFSASSLLIFCSSSRVVCASSWEHLIYQFAGHDHLIEYVFKGGQLAYQREV